ncbi:MAG: hypothetical protein IPJ65_29490 [Archangiaceae bacterium]|nr:hypothetical protein [Archangiaceae bacterium]
MRSLTLIATLVTLVACPGPAPMGTVDSGLEPVDAGVDAGVADAGHLCGEQTPAADPSCGTLSSWVPSPVMGPLRNHHSSVLAEVDAGAFLYVLAGVEGSRVFAGVNRAKVNDDGSLEAFEELPQALPVAEGGGTGCILNDLLMVAGGNIPGGVTDQSSFARIGPDGSLSAFIESGSVGHPRMHPASVSRGDHVYVLGGFRDPDVWDDVVKAQWYPNHTLSPWNPAGKLPGKRSHMSVSRVGDYVYLVGGLEQSAFNNPPMMKAVHRGHFDEHGDLGEWVAQPDFPITIATHASAAYGGYLYVVGGITDTGSTDHVSQVFRSAIGADHSLGAWEMVASLPVARGHVHNLPVFKNHLYSIGGAIDFSLHSTPAIQIGTFQN